MSETCLEPLVTSKMHKLDAHILEQLKANGEMHTNEIIATIPEQERNVRSRLSILKRDGKTAVRKRSYHRIATNASAPPPIPTVFRTSEQNQHTIDKLLNLFDDLLDNYTDWAADNMGKQMNFEKQLQFIENFKLMTMIGDKLMKRWSLEHVGYDTNTRLAQEDAKAKTAEREKAAVENAPLRDRVVVVGKYDPKAETLLDLMPSSVAEMTDEEAEKVKV